MTQEEFEAKYVNQIVCGDCLDVMKDWPDGCVDLVLTDPPYGIDFGRAGGFCASHGWGPWRENVEWDVERPPKAAFDLMLRFSKHQIIWGGNYFTDYLPRTMRWLVWDKGQREFSLADCEFAWNDEWKASRVFNYPRGCALKDGKQHPTQKPLALMEWCLSFYPYAAVILDCYCGVGTTCVAAKKLGRRFVGIDIIHMTTQTTTHQGRPTAWRPKHGQWFNAYVRRWNKLHAGGPFKCSQYYSSSEHSQFVEGTDAEGDTCVFKLAVFRIEPLVKNGSQ